MGVNTPSIGMNYGFTSFGQLSRYIVLCALLIGGASPPIWVRYKMQCSQKVGQKKWSHNSSQKTSRTSTPTPPLLKGLLTIEV